MNTEQPRYLHFFYLFSDFIKGILSSSKYSMKLFKRPHDKVNHLPKCGRKVKVNCINGPIKNSPYGYKNPVNLPYQHSPYAPLLAQPWKPRGAGYSQGMGTQMPPWIQWIQHIEFVIYVVLSEKDSSDLDKTMIQSSEGMKPTWQIYYANEWLQTINSRYIVFRHPQKFCQLYNEVNFIR